MATGMQKTLGQVWDESRAERELRNGSADPVIREEAEKRPKGRPRRYEPSETIFNGTRSKVDHYGWKVADEPGRFAMVDKNQVIVDPAYQREPDSVAKLRAMASEWSWVACGTLLLAERDDGVLAAIDGDHRILAARMRDDISQLPAMIYRSLGIVFEAKGFIRANTNRKAMSSYDKFRAKLAARDEVAIFVDGLLRSAGYEATKNRTTGRVIKGVGKLCETAIRTREALVAGWPVVVLGAQGGPITEFMLEGLVRLEAMVAKHGLSLMRQPWKGRIEALGPEGIRDACVRASAYHAKGGAAIWAKGIAVALNKGVQKRLPVTEDGGE